jgi:hypothetical protein
MADLADISIEELRSKVEELQALVDQRNQETIKATNPQPLPSPDFGPLVELCQGYIDDLEKWGYVDERYKQWMFETAMQAVFGNDVWEWTNPILRGE